MDSWAPSFEWASWILMMISSVPFPPEADPPMADTATFRIAPESLGMAMLFSLPSAFSIGRERSEDFVFWSITWDQRGVPPWA